MADPNPIGDPRTQAALYGLLSGTFPGTNAYAPGSQPITLAGISPQGMATNVPSARASAFLQAMGAGSPGPVLMGAARRLAAKNAPPQFVGSGADKEAQLNGVMTPQFQVQMPQSGAPVTFRERGQE